MVKQTVYRNSSRVTIEFGNQQSTISLYHLILPHLESLNQNRDTNRFSDRRFSSFFKQIIIRHHNAFLKSGINPDFKNELSNLSVSWQLMSSKENQE